LRYCQAHYVKETLYFYIFKNFHGFQCYDASITKPKIIHIRKYMIWIVLGLVKSNENHHLKLMHHNIANHERLMAWNFTNELLLTCNTFVSCMEFWILSYGNCIFVIHITNSRGCLWDTYFMNKCAQPNNFYRGIK